LRRIPKAAAADVRLARGDDRWLRVAELPLFGLALARFLPAGAEVILVEPLVKHECKDGQQHAEESHAELDFSFHKCPLHEAS
jgi:hypothetical protein